jgi:hypothetical protein
VLTAARQHGAEIARGSPRDAEDVERHELCFPRWSRMQARRSACRRTIFLGIVVEFTDDENKSEYVFFINLGNEDKCAFYFFGSDDLLRSRRKST